MNTSIHSSIHYGRRWVSSAHGACSFLLHDALCSALSCACSQSVGHPADTILAPFTRVCWPQPAFVVCILNAQQRRIPPGPAVSWNKPSATAPLSPWPWERWQAQIKWIHILYRPQPRIHSFCRPAVDRITSTRKTFFYGFHSWQLKSVEVYFFQTAETNGWSKSTLRFHILALLFLFPFLILKMLSVHVTPGPIFSVCMSGSHRSWCWGKAMSFKPPGSFRNKAITLHMIHWCAAGQ